MIKPETYHAIKEGDCTELRTSNGTPAVGLEIDPDGDILGVVGNTGAFWNPNGTQLFPCTQSGVGDLTDE